MKSDKYICNTQLLGSEGFFLIMVPCLYPKVPLRDQTFVVINFKHKLLGGLLPFSFLTRTWWEHPLCNVQTLPRNNETIFLFIDILIQESSGCQLVSNLISVSPKMQEVIRNISPNFASGREKHFHRHIKVSICNNHNVHWLLYMPRRLQYC